MELGLDGRTAVVTGASRGVGLATVRALRDEGVVVVGAARTVTPELTATGTSAVAVDLATEDGATRLIDAAIAELGGVDLLVNNVGGGDVDLRGFLDLPEHHWRSAFEVNLFSALRVSRAALPSLIERRGAIVNVSSIGSRQPAGPPLAYNVAKSALTALGKGLADEFGPRGVRVTTVSPGPTRTAMWEGPDGFGGAFSAATGTPQADLVAGVPEMLGMRTGRMVEPEEVAALIVFLLAAGSVTGSDHLIDGGVVRSA